MATHDMYNAARVRKLASSRSTPPALIMDMVMPIARHLVMSNSRGMSDVWTCTRVNSNETEFDTNHMCTTAVVHS